MFVGNLRTKTASEWSTEALPKRKKGNRLRAIRLVRAGRLGEAEASLRWLRGDDSGHDVAAELRFLNGQARIQAATVVRLADLTKPWAVKPLVIVALIMFFQQWCGINAALFFAVSIFQAAGSTLAPAVSAVLINLTNVRNRNPFLLLIAVESNQKDLTLRWLQ